MAEPAMKSLVGWRVEASPQIICWTKPATAGFLFQRRVRWSPFFRHDASAVALSRRVQTTVVIQRDSFA